MNNRYAKISNKNSANHELENIATESLIELSDTPLRQQVSSEHFNVKEMTELTPWDSNARHNTLEQDSECWGK